MRRGQDYKPPGVYCGPSCNDKCLVLFVHCHSPFALGSGLAIANVSRIDHIPTHPPLALSSIYKHAQVKVSLGEYVYCYNTSIACFGCNLIGFRVTPADFLDFWFTLYFQISPPSARSERMVILVLPVRYEISSLAMEGCICPTVNLPRAAPCYSK